MLQELRIRNFAIIDEANLEFGPGLNVLSGETGAGKTIILSALGLLLGARGSADVIRAGEKEAVVEALVELEGEAPIADLERGPRAGGELVIRRASGDGGRTRVTSDGTLGTVQTLGKVGAALVQVYGQHEQQSLLRTESHREILDRFARLEDDLVVYRSVYESAQKLRSRLEELSRLERERANLLDLARFRVAELEKAQLSPNEDEDLPKERTVLAN